MSITKNASCNGTKQYYRPKEAASYLGIGRSTLWLYIAQGKLQAKKPSERVTIIAKSDLDAFVNGGSK